MKLADNPIVSNSQAAEVLRRALRHERLAHAYLIHGPVGAGKEAIALSLVQSFLCEQRWHRAKTESLFANEAEPEWVCGQCLNCRRVAELSHPDVHVVFPHPSTASETERSEVLKSLSANPFNRLRPWENPWVLINDIRELKKDLSVTSYEGHGAVALLLEAHRMKAESANALLKLLEEPPADTYLVLTTDSLAALLPTIVSRCQPIQVSAPSRPQIADFLQRARQIEASRADFVAKISNNNLRYALDLLEEELDSKRSLAVEFLRMAFKFNKPVEQVEFLNRLASDNDRRELQQLLRFCLLWVRDAYVLKSCGSEIDGRAFIVNLDLHDSLADLVRNLPDFDFEGVLEEIEYAHECLERYVQPWLVLMVLLHRIRLLARPKR